VLRCTKEVVGVFGALSTIQPVGILSSKIIVLPFSIPVAVPVIRNSPFPTLLQELKQQQQKSNKIISLLIS
jgi:hypothetical protein